VLFDWGCEARSQFHVKTKIIIPKTQSQPSLEPVFAVQNGSRSKCNSGSSNLLHIVSETIARMHFSRLSFLHLKFETPAIKHAQIIVYLNFLACVKSCDYFQLLTKR
jgi:hypothetical protein